MPLATVATVTVNTYADGSYTREFTVGDWEMEHADYYRTEAREFAQWIGEDPDTARVTLDIR